ncbi:hypothetical protein YC2023_028471 [Brassica napus]
MKKKLRGIEEQRKKMRGEVRRRKINLTSTTDQVHGFVLVCSELESQKTMSFTGTQQKCRACEETVYAMELLSADGVPFQKSCFKCSHCKSTLQATKLRYVLKQCDR